MRRARRAEALPPARAGPLWWRAPGESRRGGDHRETRPMLSLVDILRRIDAGQTTAPDAVRESREAAMARNPALKAFVRFAEPAAASAPGPLAGIAVGVKD